MITIGAGCSSGPSTSKSDAHGVLFNELMQEVKHSPPGARFSARLRAAIERLPPVARRALVSRLRDGCAPLFVACRRGNLEMVEYLVHVCDADLEQLGVYEVPEERTVHCVTALWCAAVSGRLPVLKALADAGARLDAGSDSGSTPVRSACFMTHENIVRFLVSRGADIHRANHNGGTCLINSVQCPRLCAFLLDNGAEVDARDMQLKTALHYAVQEQRVESARLLLSRGANPYLRSRSGDDALRTAALKGAAQVLQLLASTVQYPVSKLADAYELLGATQLDEFNDVSAALAAWRRATALRHANGGYIEKTPEVPPAGALGNAREWRSLAALAALADDADQMRVQALLVAGRVLGPLHKDHIFRLMYRGAAYADAFRHQRCIDLWTWSLKLRLERDGILQADTCITACALTRLLIDCRGALPEPPFNDVVAVLDLLVDALPTARETLTVLPLYKKQADTFDRALRCLVHLIYLLEETATTDEEKRKTTLRVRRIVSMDLRSALTGDSLLHLSASRLNVVRSSYSPEEVNAAPLFPCVRVARRLLAGGADPRQRNEGRSTPLHVAVVPYNFSTELVETLLEGGAHLDQPNRFGDSAFELLLLNRHSRVCPLRYMTLRCLAARTLVKHKLVPPPHTLPPGLPEFVSLHCP